ncbi:MAG: T9SS type A sorting domain-containing protein [Bacteroidales bacterium]|nr:T9SS type A sorting domain-containing protein [Bacteroidales bacterium]
MKKLFTLLAVASSIFFLVPAITAQESVILPQGYQPDTRIDNMGYWRAMAKMGLVPVQPFIKIPPATFTGTKVLIDGVLVDDSPDVPVTTESSHQSENSIVVNPNNSSNVLNSNNSGNWPSTTTFYGADRLKSDDAGLTWGGSIQGPVGGNQGDPVALINMNGRYFINYIDNQYGQTAAWSDDSGATWASAKISNGSMFNMLDKNHMWVDNSPTSPFNGYLYCGWMESNNIQVSRSITNGTSWEPKVNISLATSAGSHNQGINFKTGPDGEAYAAWAVYDNWPGDEKAIGFAKSLDGGITWQTAVRALNNIKGVRTSGVPQNQRVNSFPSMACDISNSIYRGTIYIVWPNIGVPGINSGSDRDIYLIKSTDQGATWSVPSKVNQDPIGQGKTHYMSWIACDQASGQLAVVYYDNRNLPNNQCETWMAWSQDGGDTWEEMKVSDVSWTPSPISGMATGYFGDYLGIDVYNGKAYPCWTDNRGGYAMTYVSPIDLHIPASLVVYNDDNLNDTTFGNGNGKMDYGETILLGLEMQNDGDMEASDVTVTLSTESPYITFEDSTEFYGNFDVGESITILDAFKFSVSSFIPDGYIVNFQVTAVNSLDSATVSFFGIEAHAPAVTIMGMAINDAAGNNNGRLDPGESATVSFMTKNTGEYDALDIISTLESSNPFVTVVDDTYDIGTLTPGESVFAEFPVVVSDACPYGSATVFHNVADWEFGMDEVYKTTAIGLLVEDWETGNFLKFPWESSGNLPWVIDPDIKWEGNYSAHSGEITDNETSVLFIGYNVLTDDSISFYRKISSQIIFDKLNFYIDTLLVGTWTGSYDWKRIAYPVMAGPHTFKWEYIKNESSSVGDDRAWLDYIVFPPEYKTAASAGNDGSVCAGNTYQLMSAAIAYDSLRWSTSGTGTFDDASLYNPIYTPSNEDIAAGSVLLTITAYGEAGIIVTDEMTLTIESPPQANAGPDASGCADGYLISDASASDYTEITWLTDGDGIFSDIHIINPIYVPGELDITNGTASLSLLAASSGICDPAGDTMVLTILPTPQVDLGQDTAICAQLTCELDATTSGAASYLWSPGGETTPVITADSSGTGIGSQTYSVVVTNGDGCEGTDEITITFKDCTGMNELAENLKFTVFPNPNSGFFTIQLTSRLSEHVNLRMIGTTGEVVYEIKNLFVIGDLNVPVNVGQLKQGSYILEVSNDSGKVYGKVVVQK